MARHLWVILAALLAGGAAVAQVAPPDDTPQAEPQARAPGPPAAGRLLTSQLERHIASLHRRLRITPSQQAQFDAFAQILRENAAHAQLLHQPPAEAEHATAVEHLRAYAARAQAHAEDVQRLVPAFQRLYDAMSPEQQKAADAALREFEEHGLHGHS